MNERIAKNERRDDTAMDYVTTLPGI